jgi:hypothetical protein
VAQPDFIASSAIRRSWEVTPALASQTTSATSARSAARWEHRVVLDRLLHLGLAADAGRVDQAQAAAAGAR